MKNKIILLTVGLLSAAAGAGLTATFQTPEVQFNETIKEVIKEVEIMVPVEVPIEIETIVEKEVITEVLVDNGNYATVLEHLYERDGNVEYLINDLDDDEVSQIAERIVFETESIKLSKDAIKKDLFDELDKVVINGVTLDEDDMERLKINSDIDEVEVIDSDFEDGDITLRFTGDFEQDNVEYDFTVDVVFKDNEYDELRNINVQ